MKSLNKGKFFSILSVFIIFTVIIVISLSGPSQSENNYISFHNDKDYIEGELIVMLKKNVDVIEFTSQFDNIDMQVKESIFEDYNIWLLSYDNASSQPVDALLSVMSKPEVDIVQFNHKVQLRQTTPNDTRFNEMWGLNNTGQSGGTVDADIDAPEAWDITTGGLTAAGDTIVAAVIDNGFFLTHNDVNFWKNWDEIPGNNIDDDGNGYIDDVNGWNARNSNGNITSASHGTHVSGTIGAHGNNNLGVTGVNWNVKVMAIQGSSTQEATVLRAYGYVLKQRLIYNQTNGSKGAYVVSTNSSFGVNRGNPASYPLWCAFYDSLGNAGILSAGAGPNIGLNIDTEGDVPTACPSDFMISVTNTTRNDVRNSGAGWGPINMDIGAPGTSILSTNPSNNYGTSTGTSMATPHVAGSIALMYAAADISLINLAKTNPDSVARIMKQIMMENVDTLTALNNILSNGRLNLHKSILAISNLTSITPVSTEPASYKLSQNYPNPFNPSTKINFSVPVKGFVSLKVFDVSGKQVASLVENQINSGEYSVEFNGGSLSSGIYFYSLKTNEFTQTRKMMLIK